MTTERNYLDDQKYNGHSTVAEFQVFGISLWTSWYIPRFITPTLFQGYHSLGADYWVVGIVDFSLKLDKLDLLEILFI